MAGTKSKPETERPSFTKEMTRLVAEVVNEAHGWAMKLGFEPGPDLCERVREEDSWWVERGIEIDAHEARQSGEGIGKEPRRARAACVAVLESLLNPYAEALSLISSAGDLEEMAQSIEDDLTLLRKYAPLAGGPPSPRAISAFREKRLAEQRMAELERQLAETRRQNAVA
jgi:hypothetical protein